MLITPVIIGYNQDQTIRTGNIRNRRAHVFQQPFDCIVSNNLYQLE